MQPDPTFTPTDLSLIEHMAEGMARQEICDWFGLRHSELPKASAENFEKAWLKGRAGVRFFAMTALKNQCQGKDGYKAAVAILSQFGSEWEHAGDAANIKSFKIVLDD